MVEAIHSHQPKRNNYNFLSRLQQYFPVIYEKYKVELTQIRELKANRQTEKWEEFMYKIFEQLSYHDLSWILYIHKQQWPKDKLSLRFAQLLEKRINLEIKELNIEEISSIYFIMNLSNCTKSNYSKSFMTFLSSYSLDWDNPPAFEEIFKFLTNYNKLFLNLDIHGVNLLNYLKSTKLSPSTYSKQIVLFIQLTHFAMKEIQEESKYFFHDLLGKYFDNLEHYGLLDIIQTALQLRKKNYLGNAYLITIFEEMALRIKTKKFGIEANSMQVKYLVKKIITICEHGEGTIPDSQLELIFNNSVSLLLGGGMRISGDQMTTNFLYILHDLGPKFFTEYLGEMLNEQLYKNSWEAKKTSYTKMVMPPKLLPYTASKYFLIDPIQPGTKDLLLDVIDEYIDNIWVFESILSIYFYFLANYSYYSISDSQKFSKVLQRIEEQISNWKYKIALLQVEILPFAISLISHPSLLPHLPIPVAARIRDILLSQNTIYHNTMYYSINMSIIMQILQEIKNLQIKYIQNQQIWDIMKKYTDSLISKGSVFHMGELLKIRNYFVWSGYRDEMFYQKLESQGSCQLINIRTMGRSRTNYRMLAKPFAKI